MKEPNAEAAIYFVELVERRPRGTLNVREIRPYAETAPGSWERCDVFTEADVLAGIRTRIPYGPRPVPPKDMINFVGVGSGFAPNTPRLRLEVLVYGEDGDRPLQDFCGSAFRSGAWTVTTSAKNVLLCCDPVGFECLPIDTELLQGDETLPSPELWLCELVRFATALEDVGQKLLPLAREAKLRFDARAIGPLTFFREASLPSEWVFCTEVGRRAIVDAGLTGLKFEMWGRQHD